MNPELIYLINLEHQRELRAQAEADRLAKSAAPTFSLTSSALLVLANGLISGGHRLRGFAQRRRRPVYQTTSPCN